MNIRNLLAGIAAAALFATGASGAEGPRSAQGARTGVVTSIKALHVHRRTSGAGAVLGGIAGGVLGHQVGAGLGKDLATVAGAVGGAVVGNEVEKNRGASRVRYAIRVRLDDGRYRGFRRDHLDGLRVGDRVSVENGTIRR